MNNILNTLEKSSRHLRSIAEKVVDGKRISAGEGIILYEEGELGFLGMLANHVREKKNKNYTYFNRNIHIEPTNLCVFDCKFCSYSRLLKQKGDADSWEMTAEQMLAAVKNHDQTITEVHIVGGVHPKMDLYYFADLLKQIKIFRPDLHIKAFTAVELEYMFRKAKVSYAEGIKILKAHGLDSIPGGGAEIFDAEIRKQICEDKCTTEQWLELHETAHRQGIHSNATMLYGHIESFEHRIDHMDRLRNLQDITKGFNCFIPLKFRNSNNQMSHFPEVSVIEDLRNYAVSRIFMDNIPHIKAYWPMIGKSTAQLSLQFGVDDLDGTINDSTKIYSMAGAEDQNPSMRTDQLVDLIKQAGRIPAERDTLYNIICDYKNHDLVSL
ncbi:MAG: aminofutalosine synthase MqnE [Bacteroidetes bacterium]|nr:MAG: aminofutalosine synthase MqnE [Bacteroidota bacterium]